MQNAAYVAPTLGSKLYWYGAGGEVLGETDANGNTTAEYIFFGGKRVAMLPAGGSAQFYIEDLLGTSRVMTTNTGVVCYDADFYPYGGERAPYTNTCTQNNYKFEGKERDAETGNDDFGARYYSNRFGRWLSADWSNVPIAVPYANLSNPQTLNLYSMVADDPESFADLDGHCDQNDWCGVLGRMALTYAKSEVTRFLSDSKDYSVGFGKGLVSSHAPLSNEAQKTGAEHAEFLVQNAPNIIMVVGGLKGPPSGAPAPDEEPGGSFMGPKEGESGGPGAGKDFSPATKQDIVNENATANGGSARCVYCGDKVSNESGPNKVNVDHVQAKANGGNNTQQNGQVTCQYCNQSKGTSPAPKNPKPMPDQP